jgi:hypothetical protein
MQIGVKILKMCLSLPSLLTIMMLKKKPRKRHISGDKKEKKTFHGTQKQYANFFFIGPYKFMQMNTQISSILTQI